MAAFIFCFQALEHYTGIANPLPYFDGGPGDLLELRQELTKHKLLWDAAELRITNVVDANQFLRREYREGWTV